MNPSLTITRDVILGIYQSVKADLASGTTHALTDLLHESSELRHSAVFTIRTAAEMNYTACMEILETRRNQPTKTK